MNPPIDTPRTCADSISSASRTDSASPANCSMENGPGSFEERPAPRLSKAIVRRRAANAGSWSRQAQIA